VRVQIRFLPAVVRYVQEGTWHASQKLSPQHDGSLIAEFCLSNTTEIERWVLSFGKNAEILSPASLRASVEQELLATLANYQLAAHEQVPAGKTNNRTVRTKSHKAR